MRRVYLIWPLVTVGILLSGCQQLPPHSLVTGAPNSFQQPVKPSLTTQTQSLQNATASLAMAGAIDQPINGLASPIRSNSQRVTIDWDGDAIELLNQLAQQRGLRFAYTGVRLPLPLTLHAQDVTFESLLRIIRTQIDWRAQLDQQPSELRLYFMLPLKQGKLA